MSARIRHHIRSNVVGYMALFVALSGTAYAVDGPLAGQNTVGSLDIINGEVTNDDLAANSIGSGKLADRQVKNADLSLGASSSNTIADGGVQSIDILNDSLTGVDVSDAGGGTLGGADIAEDRLDLANDSVGSLESEPDEIVNGSVGTADVLDDGLSGLDVAESTLAGTALMGRIDSLPGASAYFPPIGVTSSPAVNEFAASVLSPGAEILARDLAVKIEVPPGEGANHQFTLRDDGADTAVACTISDTATSCDSGSAAAAISAGSELALEVVTEASCPNTSGECPVPDTDVLFGWRAVGP